MARYAEQLEHFQEGPDVDEDEQANFLSPKCNASLALCKRQTLLFLHLIVACKQLFTSIHHMTAWCIFYKGAYLHKTDIDLRVDIPDAISGVT